MIEGFSNIEDLRIFENRLKEISNTSFLVWKVGVNLALRVSDVLKIQTKEAEKMLKIGTYNSKDKKTSKRNIVKLNPNTIQALKEALELRKGTKVSDENPFLFVGTGNRTSNSLNSITRQSIDRFFKQAVEDENLDIKIGTHTMRKTWGTLSYKNGVKVESIQKRLNHTSPGTTLLYLGISDKVIDDIVAEMNI